MSHNDDLSRRDVVKIAGAAGLAAAAVSRIDGFPGIRTVKAANDQVQFGMIGTGSRGSYLLKHLAKIDNGRCVALCDVQQEAIDRGVKTIGTNPKTFKDYRELLGQKDVDAVFVTTPLFMHYPVTNDALQAGKHVFCEKALVFKPEEVHGLRALAAQHPKQILQTGLQRRYSKFYQAVKDMVAKGVLGDVRYIHAQWHRNMINKPSSLWTMKPGGDTNLANWRLYRKYSGGLVAELTSHQVDVADWMFNSSPEWVMGYGSLNDLRDGRDVYDNVQLIYHYPKGQQLTWSGVSTNQHLPMFNATRAEMGEIIMGTEGTIHLTVGADDVHAIAWWYREPPKPSQVEKDKKKTEKAVAGATMVSGGASRPIPLLFDDLNITKDDSFLDREVKFARRWLYSKGVLVQEEDTNPVDTELSTFFQNCRDMKRPKADLEVGMADSIAVMLSNQAMDEGRKVYFNEIEKTGLKGKPAAAPAGAPAKPKG
jgi:predicted dehydrogenase